LGLISENEQDDEVHNQFCCKYCVQLDSHSFVMKHPTTGDANQQKCAEADARDGFRIVIIVSSNEDQNNKVAYIAQRNDID